MFSLDNDVTRIILTDFLELKEIGSLDTALAQKSIRVAYLQCIENSRLCPVPEDYNSFKLKHVDVAKLGLFFEWVAKRQLILQSLSIDMGRYDILRTNISSLMLYNCYNSLEIAAFCNIVGEFAELSAEFGKCKKLRKIYCGSYTPDNQWREAQPEWCQSLLHQLPALEEANIELWCNNIAIHDMASPKIEKLSLSVTGIKSIVPIFDDHLKFIKLREIHISDIATSPVRLEGLIDQDEILLSYRNFAQQLKNNGVELPVLSLVGMPFDYCYLFSFIAPNVETIMLTTGLTGRLSQCLEAHEEMIHHWPDIQRLFHSPQLNWNEVARIYLQQLMKLTSVTLRLQQLDEYDFSCLSNLPKLTSVSISFGSYSDTHAAITRINIPIINRLEAIELDRTVISTQALESIFQCCHLKSVIFRNCACRQFVFDCNRIGTMVLEHLEVDKADFVEFTALTVLMKKCENTLHTISFKNAQTVPCNFWSLIRLYGTKLRHIRIPVTKTFIPSEFMEALQSKQHPMIVKLQLYRSFEAERKAYQNDLMEEVLAMQLKGKKIEVIA